MRLQPRNPDGTYANDGVNKKMACFRIPRILKQKAKYSISRNTTFTEFVEDAIEELLDSNVSLNDIDSFYLDERKISYNVRLDPYLLKRITDYCSKKNRRMSKSKFLTYAIMRKLCII